MLRCVHQEEPLESADEAVYPLFYPEVEQWGTNITLRGYTVFQPTTCHALGISWIEDMSDAYYVGFQIFVKLKY
jgi:hypothetical protein